MSTKKRASRKPITSKPESRTKRTSTSQPADQAGRQFSVRLTGHEATLIALYRAANEWDQMRIGAIAFRPCERHTTEREADAMASVFRRNPDIGVEEIFTFKRASQAMWGANLLRNEPETRRILDDLSAEGGAR
jgi:hypothetical protein